MITSLTIQVGNDPYVIKTNTTQDSLQAQILELHQSLDISKPQCRCLLKWGKEQFQQILKIKLDKLSLLYL